MAFEIDKTQMLIETVKKYPMLYDNMHENYKDMGTKNKLWNTIAETIQDGDGDSLKTKWKNLRDAYIKHIRCNKSNKTNAGATPKFIRHYKAWPWAKHMSFLRPYLKYVQLRSHPQKKKLDASELQKYQVQETLITDAGSSHQDNINTTDLPIMYSHQQFTHNRLSDPTESQVDKVFDFLSKRHTDYDDIDLIFLGYAKTVKKMSKSRQATVKFHVAKLIMESELEELGETTVTTLDTKPFQQDTENNGFYFAQV
ncbi:unnamed protein product [Chilo suppressalis]|uniref:MADF domain-containing protein n=1 Tax=Chilo suppressalis TaxID=168631 RepID=A0ABN8AYS2_CHISP|nr:unnamed protein product [Chilo suppressalis]